MKKSLLFATTIATCSAANAGLFDAVKDIAAEMAADVAADVAADAADYISGVIFDFDANQTEDEKAVADKYKSKHGALPQSPLVSSYKTEVLPGTQVPRGAKVIFSSTVELVPGQNGQEVNVMETLTIWDNEDSSLELRSTSKSVTGGATTGGIFNGQFTITFPEDLPKGTYPITTAITINGEQLRSDKTYLDIASLQRPVNGELVANLD